MKYILPEGTYYFSAEVYEENAPWNVERYETILKTGAEEMEKAIEETFGIKKVKLVNLLYNNEDIPVGISVAGVISNSRVVADIKIYKMIVPDFLQCIDYNWR